MRSVADFADFFVHSCPKVGFDWSDVCSKKKTKKQKKSKIFIFKNDNVRLSWINFIPSQRKFSFFFSQSTTTEKHTTQHKIPLKERFNDTTLKQIAANIHCIHINHCICCVTFKYVGSQTNHDLLCIPPHLANRHRKSIN